MSWDAIPCSISRLKSLSMVVTARSSGSPPTISVTAVSYSGNRSAGSAVAGNAPARAIALELRDGFPYAQLYAPAGEGFVCFEPMTAPTNALRSGQSLPHVAPGELFASAFAIVVSSGA